MPETTELSHRINCVLNTRAAAPQSSVGNSEVEFTVRKCKVRKCHRQSPAQDRGMQDTSGFMAMNLARENGQREKKIIGTPVAVLWSQKQRMSLRMPCQSLRDVHHPETSQTIVGHTLKS